MGLIFTKGDLKEVSEEVAKYKVCFLSSRLIAFPSLFLQLACIPWISGVI